MGELVAIAQLLQRLLVQQPARTVGCRSATPVISITGVTGVTDVTDVTDVTVCWRPVRYAWMA